MRISPLRPTTYLSVALVTGVLLLPTLGVPPWPDAPGGVLGIPISISVIVAGTALAVFGLLGDRSWRVGNTLYGVSLAFFGLNSFFNGKLLVPTAALFLASAVESVVWIARELRSRQS